MIGAGDLRERVQFLRAAAVDDGLQSRPGGYALLGSPVWAARSDISDGESVAMGQERGVLTSRFVVRRSVFSLGVTVKDRLRHEGRDWHIQGIKEARQREFLEILATVKVA